MATNAIVAIKSGDTYRGAMVWYDAFPMTLGKRLKTSFKTADEARELVDVGDINAILTVQELKLEKPSEYAQIFKLKNRKNIYIRQATDRPLLAPKDYASLDELKQEGVNYIYVFDPDTSKWGKVNPQLKK